MILGKPLNTYGDVNTILCLDRGHLNEDLLI